VLAPVRVEEHDHIFPHVVHDVVPRVPYNPADPVFPLYTSLRLGLEVLLYVLANPLVDEVLNGINSHLVWADILFHVAVG
jgi:hypothetical protein